MKTSRIPVFIVVTTAHSGHNPQTTHMVRTTYLERMPGQDKAALLAFTSVWGSGRLYWGLANDHFPLWRLTTSRQGAGRSCPDFSISSRKAMIL